MFRFLHAADIHLDSPLRGLERYEGAPAERIRGATRNALENLVQLAVEQQVAFVLLVGDLYDGDWRDYNTGLFLAKEMTKLRKADISVFVVAGNHDAASQITRSLHLPENVTSLSTRVPETVQINELGVTIHGQGFPRRVVPEDLSKSYPEASPGLFNIGLLHTSVTGREGHDVYAPCTVEGLLSKGYDYWALGHVHQREVLHQDPWILFPGNTQGRHIRETGPKGCTLVTVEGGSVEAVEHRDLDVLRWAVCRVDAAGIERPEEAVERVRKVFEEELDGGEGRLLALRVEVEGACRAHAELLRDPARWVNEIRAAATDVSWGSLWVEKVKLRTRSLADLDDMVQREDALGDLLRYIGELDPCDDEVRSLTQELSDLRAKLPAELFQGEEALDWESPAGLREILDDLKHLLVPRLLSGGEGR
jgi:DNA repair exonuclease SbcCD nuclease subunit